MQVGLITYYMNIEMVSSQKKELSKLAKFASFDNSSYFCSRNFNNFLI
jgi:hypothetical protein